jgi:hypothetical protein
VRNPYVTGTYVVGPRYYGRETLLDYVLRGPSPATWLIGNRRIGKTSTLRQLEALAEGGGQQVPIYLDLQGCESTLNLGQYLADAIAEHPERYDHLGVKPGNLPGDVVSALKSIRRAAMLSGCELLLLCDESEALLQLARTEAEAMQRLHSELTHGRGLRVVMASARGIFEMQDICVTWPTSPFLEGFDLSHTLGCLSTGSVRALLTQAQAPEGEQVRADPEIADQVVEATNGHPYLVQVLCSRLFVEDGTLRPPVERDYAVEPTLRGFLNHDFSSLTDADRALLLAVHTGQSAEVEDLESAVHEPLAEAHRRIYNLETLGYLRRTHDRYTIGNRFLANWLSLRPEALTMMSPAKPSEGAVHSTLARQQAQETAYLVARIRNCRARVIELEAVRARDMLGVSASVLAEIELLQQEIAQALRSISEIEP